jgi:opacity protein-like surface antigen
MSRFAPPFHLPSMEAIVNRRMRRMYALLFVLVIPGAAAAQTPAGPPASASASASAAEEPIPRWDTAGFFGWRGTRVDEDEYNSRRWDARLFYGGTLGYYWTTNLKLELDVSGTAPSNYYTFEQHTVQGVGYPFYIRTDHRETTASFSGMVIYQFFDNVGFHPFLGAGAGVISIRERVTTPRQSQVVNRGSGVNGPFEVVVIAEERHERDDDVEPFGQIVAGFKAYPNERLFFRSDVLWSAGSPRFRDVTWRLGFGVDF